MAITKPTIQEIQQRISNDLIISINSGQLDTSKQVDPNLRNSAIKGIVDAMSAGFDENNDFLEQVLKQIFPQTATGEYLELWASWFGITRKSAQKASGYVVFTGTAGTSISSNTSISNSLMGYKTIDSGTITAKTISITSLTRSGSTVTVTTVSGHGLATGNSVAISGAVETDYNVTTAVSVTGLNTFQYEITTTPTTPATGTILASYTNARVAVLADDFGSNGNAGNGSTFSLVSPIANVDNSVIADYEGLFDGLDLETDDSLRARLLERCANLTAPFTSGGIPIFLKEKVAGIDRVWVYDATPSAGYVTIYFTINGSIPTGSQVNEAKAAIIATNGIKPANTPDAYVLVLAPSPLTVNFTFSAVSPNTTEMKNAIKDSLSDFFKNTQLGATISLNQINSVIYSTIDSSGNQPTFTLTSPSGDIVPTSSQLPILGTVTF